MLLRAWQKLAPLRTLAAPSGVRFCSMHHGGPVRQILPTDVVPKHYRLFLDPDLAAFKYKGHVEIDVDVQTTTKNVTLNVLDLDVTRASLNGQDAVAHHEETENQSIKYTFPNAVRAGNEATLRFEFIGVLNDKLRGFYRSVHRDTEGKQHVVATTQMEPTDCRRAFPCFDEPALKATFDISVAADEGLTVLSNSDVKTIDQDGTRKTVHFNRTPPMSTYVVAVVVGEIASVESTEFRVPVKVYATPGMEAKCQYSADLAAKTLGFFEEKFGIAYPLPKCDMVGIHHFSAGAMENWGLITFRLADLFFTEGEDSAAAKCRVTEVVQHELAHQWFGNLVTMDWWDGLWLNEGFATWMSWYAGNHFNPEWKVWESYVQDTYAACLKRDGVRSSHPVEVPIVRAQEVDEIFDAISYNKGSCVIRMISQFLGEDTFIKGVSLYLSRHQYKNTTTTDLWNALSEVSGKDVEKFMGPWIKEVGYPLLTVSQENQVEQNRFLSTFDVNPSEDEVLWPVTLEVRRSDGSVDHNQVLATRHGEIDGSFLKLNADQNGIYRVKYPDTLLHAIAIEGSKGPQSKLSVEDRIGVLGDLNALVGAEVPVGQLLTIAEQWKNDTHPNVVLAVLHALSNVQRQLSFQSQEVRVLFKKFQVSILVPLAQHYGQHIDDKTPFLEKELKAALFSSAVRAAESAEYIELALNMFKQHSFDIPADFSGAVYAAVAKFGTPQQWEELLQHYLIGSNVMSGHAALSAIGRSTDTNHQDAILLMLLNQTIKMQDSATAFQGLMTASPESAERGWSWLTSNWDEISTVYPRTASMLGRLVSISITAVNKPEHVTRVQQFFTTKDISGIERVYASSIDALTASTMTIPQVVKDVSEYVK